MAKKNTETELRACIDSFVEELTAIIQRNAVDSAIAALMGGETAKPGRKPGRKPKAKRAVPAAKKPTRRKRAGKRKRRSSEDVNATADAILRYVRANKGQSIAEIGAALKLTTKDMRLPIVKLVGEKKLRTTGQKRGTRYFAGAARGGARPKKKAAKRKRAKRKTAKRKTTKRKATKKKTARKKRTPAKG